MISSNEAFAAFMYRRFAGSKWTVASIALCLAIFSFRAVEIAESLPYPQHGDESFLMKSALHIAKSGDLNPHFFNYPSLPIYACTLGLGVGSAMAVVRGEPLGLAKLTWLGPPFYARPTLAFGCRLVFLAVGVLGLFWCGVAAARFTKCPTFRLLAPVGLALSPLYGHHCWNYLNVDVFAAAFTVATLAILAGSFHRRTFVAKALLPGVAAAAATASKYNAGIVLLSCLLCVLFFEQPQRRLLRSCQLSAVFVGAFLLFCPFSLLDAPAFVGGVHAELTHYATGHKDPQYMSLPGWPHLQRNLRVILDQFGFVLCAAGLLGVVEGARRQPRRTLVLLAGPLVGLLFMSLQKVHFDRNLLPFITALPVFASLGARYALFWIKRWVPRRIPETVIARGGPWFVALACAASAPVTSLQQYVIVRDSRKLAFEWLDKNGLPGAEVLVDAELRADISPLRRRARLLRRDKLDAALNRHAPVGRYWVMAAKGNGKERRAGPKVGRSVAAFGKRNLAAPVRNPTLQIYFIP